MPQKLLIGGIFSSKKQMHNARNVPVGAQMPRRGHLKWLTKKEKVAKKKEIFIPKLALGCAVRYVCTMGLLYARNLCEISRSKLAELIRSEVNYLHTTP